MKRSPIQRRTPLRSRPKAHEPAVEKEPRPLAKATRRANYGGSVSGVAVSKTPKARRGAAEQQHKAKLVLLGCMVCRRLYGPHPPGPVELHHLRGGGWGKGDWTTLIPLCAEHHRGASGVHGLGTKGFDAHYGFSQADLLADARQLSGYGGGA